MMNRGLLSPIFIFICILLIPLLTTAQTKSEDVIYLKNGSILRGEILERTDSQTIKIETVGRNVIVVMRQNVQRIGREEIPDPDPQYYKETGYVNNTGIDILTGGGATSVGFRMVNGYRFNPQLSAGLGIGFVLYDDPQNLVPIYLDLKYKLKRANTTPFVFFKTGFSFSVMSDDDLEVVDHDGGFMFSPGVGIQFETSENFGLYFTAGYNLDNSKYELEQWNDDIIETEINYRRLVLGFGFSF